MITDLCPVEIIATLQYLHRQGHDTREVFRVLAETSARVRKSSAKAGSRSLEEQLAGSENYDEAVGVSEQLELLLASLKEKRNQRPSKSRGHASQGRHRHERGRPNSSEYRSSADFGGISDSELLRTPDALIRHVVLFPQTMWSRAFYFSLAEMGPDELATVEQWFIDMNEVSSSRLDVT